MKISLINSLIYTKKYVSANMNFSNSLHSNPVSFGNDSFKKMIMHLKKLIDYVKNMKKPIKTEQKYMIPL